jgi:hypothetical protein
LKNSSNSIVKDKSSVSINDNPPSSNRVYSHKKNKEEIQSSESYDEFSIEDEEIK